MFNSGDDYRYLPEFTPRRLIPVVAPRASMPGCLVIQRGHDAVMIV